MSQTETKKSEISTTPPSSVVSFKTSQGETIRARVLRVLPQSVTFEIFDPVLVLRVSESLGDFSVQLRDQNIYSGHAVIRSLVNDGTAIICEVALDEKLWTELQFTPDLAGKQKLGTGFNQFVREWERFYLVRDDYKIVVADVQTYLASLRLWLEQIELGIRAGSETDRIATVDSIANELRAPVTASLNNFFERFELIADSIADDLQPVHRAFGQRQLHEHLLCAPFIHRTFVKPLGYAGDYEMMNMIVRNGLEGTSLYAKLINAYLLDQIGPQAVRNRVGYLEERILRETGRIARLGRKAKIFCIACGPAWEARNFIEQSALADQAHFDLLDFNEETLNYAGARMQETIRASGRKTTVSLARNSVQNLLRGRGKTGEPSYDLIYCSGLYDYLNDRIIQALNDYLYDRLTPGGLMVVGNFAPCTPVINFIEHFLEWFLIYRNSQQLLALSPSQAAPGDCQVLSEPTGANIFLEARRPL